MSGFRWAGWAVIAAFVLCCMIGCEKKPDMKMDFTAGESRAYQFWMSQQVEPHQQKIEPQRVMIRATMIFETKEILEDSSARVAVRLKKPNGLVSGKDGRKPIPQMNALEGVGFTITQEKNGEIRSIEQTGESSDQLAATIESLQMTLREMLPTLPQRLTRGTAWPRRVELRENKPPYGEIRHVTQSAFEMKQETTVDGTKAAELSVNFRILIGDQVLHSVSGEALAPRVKKEALAEGKSAEAGLNMYGLSGLGEGRGTIFVDLKRGWLLGAQYDTTIELQARMLRGEEEEQSSQTIRSHIEMQPLHAVAKPGAFESIERNSKNIDAPPTVHTDGEPSKEP